MPRIQVRFFGPAADWTGCSEKVYEFPAASRLQKLIIRLRADFPKLGQAGESLRYAVNCDYAQPDATLDDGDEVAVIPPVSGG